MKKHEKLILYMRAQIRSTTTNTKIAWGQGDEGGGLLGSCGGTKCVKGGGILLGPPLTPRTFFQRFICLLLTVLLRRHAVLLLAPLFYVSGMLLYLGNVISFDSSSLSTSLPSLGSIYRSPEAFSRFWPEMQRQPNSSSFSVMNAWQHTGTEVWKPCLEGLKFSEGLQEPGGFIIIEANGGLNQQRSSICNAVAVAGLLNATLVIPHFHLNSVWKDQSSFGDIYDEQHFIESLANYVRVVRQVPDYIMQKVQYNMSLIHNFKVKAWAPSSFYQETVLPKLLEDG